MHNPNRKIEELLSDYSEALRDGYTPLFLRSLSRIEGKTIYSSNEIGQAAEFIRILNWLCFADKNAAPSLDLFISRIITRILTRLKKIQSPKGWRSFSIRR